MERPSANLCDSTAAQANTTITQQGEESMLRNNICARRRAQPPPTRHWPVQPLAATGRSEKRATQGETSQPAQPQAHQLAPAYDQDTAQNASNKPAGHRTIRLDKVRNANEEYAQTPGWNHWGANQTNATE